MRRSALLVAVAALAALALSAGATAVAAPGTLVVRIVDTPTFLEPTPECPAGRGEAQLWSPRGAIVGSVENCIHRSDFACSEAGCRLVENALQTFRLAGGTISVRAKLTYRFNADFSSAIHVIVGSVVGGSGVYAGASGTLFGGGPIRFDPDGTPHPALTEVLILE